jgi:ATP-dependent Clp protease ATP-binding subunit ClpA
VGFGQLTREGEDEQAVQRMFTPEFRNRLDAIVPFGYLPPEIVARVIDKFVLQLELQLADRDVHITLDEDAKAWLTKKGYDKLYGARPMGRLMQEKIKQPLAEELLFGKLVHGGEVVVGLKDDALTFEVTPAAPRTGKPKKDGVAKGKSSPKAKGRATPKPAA